MEGEETPTVPLQTATEGAVTEPAPVENRVAAAKPSSKFEDGKHFAKGCVTLLAKAGAFGMMAFVILILLCTTMYYRSCYQDQVAETARVDAAWQAKCDGLKADFEKRGDGFDRAAADARQAVRKSKEVVQKVKEDATTIKKKASDLWNWATKK